MKSLTQILQNATAALLVFILSGCASIVSKSQYPVSLATNPAGATIAIFDQEGAQIHSGETPAIVTLKSGRGYFKSASYRVVATLANGETQETELKANMDGWFIGNIVFGGLIGFLVVDPLTGAMYKLPDSVTVDFTNTATAGLQVLSIEELPETLREQLIPVEG